MNIDHLKYVLEVDEKGSISKAAKSLYLNQPYLSKVIHDVEEELHIQIFSRNSQGVIATPKGREVIQSIQKIINEMNDLKSMNQADSSFQLSLVVPRASYITHAFKKYLMNQNLGEEMQIIYQETNAEQAIDLVVNGMTDIAIVRIFEISEGYYDNMLLYKNIHKQRIKSYPLVLLMSKDNPLALKKSVSIYDLKDQIQLLHGGLNLPGHMNAFIQTLLKKEQVKKTITIFERSSQLELLESNSHTFMWVSPMPQDLLDKYHLVTKYCHDYTLNVSDNLIYRQGHQLSKEEQEFIYYLTQKEGMLNEKY